MWRGYEHNEKRVLEDRRLSESPDSKGSPIAGLSSFISALHCEAVTVKRHFTALRHLAFQLGSRGTGVGGRLC